LYPRMGARFTSYAFHLTNDAARILGRDFAMQSVPHLPYPSEDRDCAATPQTRDDDVQWPSLINGLDALRARVAYPEPARQAGIEGIVFVNALVGPDGSIKCADVSVGLDGGISQAALLALLTSEFAPGSVNGEPAALWISLPITFRLQ
jgi:TonB family protein